MTGPLPLVGRLQGPLQDPRRHLLLCAHRPGRLSRLSASTIKLGILPYLIEPASLHQNGRHERMHLDLKVTTAPWNILRIVSVPLATRPARGATFESSAVV